MYKIISIQNINRKSSGEGFAPCNASNFGPSLISSCSISPFCLLSVPQSIRHFKDTALTLYRSTYDQIDSTNDFLNPYSFLHLFSHKEPKSEPLDQYESTFCLYPKQVRYDLIRQLGAHYLTFLTYMHRSK